MSGGNGTATYCKISGVDVAAKTGTTDENYDRWLCGFTPYYTAVTWFGYDQNESIEFNQRNPAGLIWANVMARIHSGLESANFEKPSTVISATICSETGKKATTGCPHTYTEYFLWFTTPELCDKHSGKELQSTKKENTEKQDKVKEIIQSITDEIDEKEPPRTNNSSNSNTTNSNVTQNEDKKQNVTNHTITNQSNTTNNTVNQTNNSQNTTNSSVNNSPSQNTSSNTTTNTDSDSAKNTANETY